MATPPPVPGSEQLTITLDATFEDKGKHKVDIEGISATAGAGVQDITFVDADSITEIEIKGFNGAGKDPDDGEQDVFRFDLATFNDDFTISIKDETSLDIFYIEGFDSEVDNGDGTFTYTYTGSDGLTHTATLDPGVAEVQSFTGPDGVVDGTTGNDTMGIGFEDADGDFIDGADGNDDTIFGGGGNDTINAGAGNDTVDGGDGTDTIDGGAGNDTIIGDSEVVIETSDFSWELIPDPNGSGPIDSGDLVTTGTIDIGAIDVTYDFSDVDAVFSPETVFVGGLSTDSGSVSSSSSIGFQTSGVGDISFSAPVENASFRINDLEGGRETVTIRAFDETGTQISFTTTLGSEVSGTNTDGVPGFDTFEGNAGTLVNDADPSGSFLIVIPGPVSSIEITFVNNGGTVALTDLVFDGPTTSASGLGDADTLSGGIGDDVILGVDGDDSISGDDGADELDGGVGNDTIDGGTGNDTILASTGTDFIDGGIGTDTYDATFGSTLSDETITVDVDSSGNGTVQKTGEGATDTITSVETYVADEATVEADVITITDTDIDDAVLDPTGDLFLASEVSDIDDSAVGTFTPADGSPAINFGPTETNAFSNILALNVAGQIQITSGDESGTVGNISFENFEEINFGIMCFARGTLIKTIDGELPIEELSVGDRVLTMDNNYQEIRWIGSRDLNDIDLTMNPKLKPILIRADALGSGFPERDLVVSPQHRILISSVIAQRMLGQREVLVPANKLLTIDGIDILHHTPDGVEYWHMLFEDHQIVWSNGAPSESLFTGPEALKAASPEGRLEIETLFPEICAPNYIPTPARYIPEKGKLMKKLAQRHHANNNPLVILSS